MQIVLLRIPARTVRCDYVTHHAYDLPQSGQRDHLDHNSNDHIHHVDRCRNANRACTSLPFTLRPGKSLPFSIPTLVHHHLDNAMYSQSPPPLRF